MVCEATHRQAGRVQWDPYPSSQNNLEELYIDQMTKNKKRIARKLLTRAEVKSGVPPFLSLSWAARKIAIKERVARHQAAAHERALARRAAEKPKTRGLLKRIFA